MLAMLVYLVFVVKQKTAYEMRISDWSSDVCSSDLFASGKPSLWRRAAHCRLDRVERGDLTDGVFGDGRLRVSRLFDEAPAQMAPAMHERPWSLRPLDAGEPIIAVIAVALQELSPKALQELFAIDRKSTRLKSSH